MFMNIEKLILKGNSATMKLSFLKKENMLHGGKNYDL